MAETPKKRSKETPKHKKPLQHFSSSDPISTPPIATTPVRRFSSRLCSTEKDSKSITSINEASPPLPSRRKSLNFTTTKSPKTPLSKKSENGRNPISPVSPDRVESRQKRKLKEVKNVGSEKKVKSMSQKRRVYYKKVVFDGSEFAAGDDVYVKRREDETDNDDPEVEECVMCFKAGKAVMIECDDCLGGFHLKCLKPPLKEVPEDNWICGFCEAKKLGKNVQLPLPPKGKKRVRTAREKLLSSDLWAAHIER